VVVVVVQEGGDSASLVTAYAALRPQDGFSQPHQEHMKDTYTLGTNVFVKHCLHRKWAFYMCKIMDILFQPKYHLTKNTVKLLVVT